MKKIMLATAIAFATVAIQAASVVWTAAGMNSYAGDKGAFFVIGQNGVESTAQIAAILDAGNDWSSYALGTATVASNGALNNNAQSTKPTLGEGTYTGFIVLFDSATPTAGESKYALISGASTLTKSIGSSTASITFAAGNTSSYVNTASNWQSFGSAGPVAPEPTSGLLLLLGMAGLALKRKHA